jgi:hypothetical protein
MEFIKIDTDRRHTIEFQIGAVRPDSPHLES